MNSNQQKSQRKIFRLLQKPYGYCINIVLLLEIILAAYLIFAQSNIYVTVFIMGMLPISVMIILLIIANKYPYKFPHFIGVSNHLIKDDSRSEEILKLKSNLNNSLQVFLKNIRGNARLFADKPENLQKIVFGLSNNLEDVINCKVKTQNEYISSVKKADVTISFSNKELEETIDYLRYMRDKNKKITDSPINVKPNRNPDESPLKGIDTTGI